MKIPTTTEKQMEKRVKEVCLNSVDSWSSKAITSKKILSRNSFEKNYAHFMRTPQDVSQIWLKNFKKKNENSKNAHSVCQTGWPLASIALKHTKYVRPKCKPLLIIPQAKSRCRWKILCGRPQSNFRNLTFSFSAITYFRLLINI